MALPQSLKVAVDLVLSGVTRGKEVTREIEHAVGTGVAEGWEKGAKEGMKRSSPELLKTTAALIESGMKAPARALKKTFEESARRQEKTAKELADITREMEGMKDEGEKRRARARKDELNWQIKTEKRAQEKLLKKQKGAAEDRLKLIRTTEDRRDMTKAQKVEEGGNALETMLQGALSADNLDMSSLTKGLAGGIGKALEGGAGMAGSAGMGGVSSAMVTMAASVTAIAALGAALVGVMAAAYGSTVELNKGIMDNASAYDILGGAEQRLGMKVEVLRVEYEGLNLGLKLLRRTVLDTAYDFRLTSEEVAGTIGALNEAGLTVSEFNTFVGEGTSLMRAYKDVTLTAITAQHGLGISASEAGEFMDKAYRDLGYSLADVQGAFGTIASEASAAGMSTKDFFAAINAASSGMALYNFRVEDTVGLFTDLVKILGEDLAKEKLGLEKTFSGMGAQDKMKTAMLGGAGMEAAVRASAEKQAETFAEAMKGKEAYLDKDLRGGIDLKSVAAMGEKQYRAQLLQLKGADETGALMRQFSTLRQASAITKGGAGGVAAAMPALDKLGELAAQMAAGSTMSGGQTLEEAGRNTISKAKMEEVTGLSGEAYDQMARIQSSMLAEFEAKGGEGGLGPEFFAAVAGGDLSQSDELKEAADMQYTMLERSARDTLLETRSMSATLKNTIAGYLESIWLGVEHLGKLFGQKWFKGDKGLKARTESIGLEKGFKGDLEKVQADILSKQTAKDAAKTPVDKARIEKEIEALREKEAVAQQAIKDEKRFREKVEGGRGKEGARRDIASEDFVEEYGKTPEEYFAEQGLSGQFAMGEAGGKTDAISGAEVEERLKVGAGTAKSYAGIDLTGSAAERLTGVAKAKEDILSGELSPEEAKEMGLDVEVDETIKEMTAEQIEAMVAEAEKDRVAVAKEAADALIEQEKTADAVEAIESALGKETAAKLAGASGLSLKAISQKMQGQKGGEASILAAVRARVESKDISEAAAREALALVGIDYAKKKEPEDFIYSGDGTTGSITPLNSRDDFYGAMAGGAIETGIRDLLSGAAGGGGDGGSKTVHIHINGGDEAKVYEVVKRVLTETGYGNLRSY